LVNLPAYTGGYGLKTALRFYYLNSLVEKLQHKVNSGTKVYGAMRYGNPSLQTVLKQIKMIGQRR
jgi:protoheme ferro-lyase